MSDPILFRPETFKRHDAAARFVEGLIRTRAPRPSSSRFPGIKPGAWGFLPPSTSISASSVLTLGQGDVTLCSRSGAVLTADGDTVHVYNSGAAIVGGGSGKFVELGWTGNAWSTCGCAGCTTTICVTNCNGAPAVGHTVTVKSGSTVIATGTTGGDGCVTLDIGSAGTYTIAVPGYSDATSVSLTCGGTTSLTQTFDDANFCCNPCNCTTPIPMILHLSDANGSTTLTLSVDPDTGLPICGVWHGCIMCPGMTCWNVSCDGTETAGTAIFYFLSCDPSTNQWKLVRQWQIGTVVISSSPLVTESHLDSYTDCGHTLHFCGTGSVGIAISIFTLANCADFTWSGSPTTSGTPPIPDPVGGTVTITS